MKHLKSMLALLLTAALLLTFAAPAFATDALAGQSGWTPFLQSIEEPAEEPAEAPAGEPAEEPAGEPADSPTETPASASWKDKLTDGFTVAGAALLLPANLAAGVISDLSALPAVLLMGGFFSGIFLVPLFALPFAGLAALFEHFGHSV